MTDYQCPVCHRPIKESRNGHTINGHHDKAGRPCPGGGCSFDIAVNTDTGLNARQTQALADRHLHQGRS